MLENLFSAEAWRSIEYAAKLLGIGLGGISAVSGGIVLLANQNAALLEKAPREVSAPEAKMPVQQEQPFSVVIVAYGGTEAQAFAEKIAGALPAGSRVGRISINQVVGWEAPGGGLGYNANGQDAAPLLNWLASRKLTAIPMDIIPIPSSIRMQYKEHIALVVGPKR